MYNIKIELDNIFKHTREHITSSNKELFGLNPTQNSKKDCKLFKYFKIWMEIASIFFISIVDPRQRIMKILSKKTF